MGSAQRMPWRSVPMKSSLASSWSAWTSPVMYCMPACP